MNNNNENDKEYVNSVTGVHQTLSNDGWLGRRRNCITSTDVARIMNYLVYGEELYYGNSIYKFTSTKINPQKPTPFTLSLFRDGHLVEQELFVKYKEKYGNKLLHNRCFGRGIILATLDFEILNENDNSVEINEIKTTTSDKMYNSFLEERHVGFWQIATQLYCCPSNYKQAKISLVPMRSLKSKEIVHKTITKWGRHYQALLKAIPIITAVHEAYMSGNEFFFKNDKFKGFIDIEPKELEDSLFEPSLYEIYNLKQSKEKNIVFKFYNNKTSEELAKEDILTKKHEEEEIAKEEMLIKKNEEDFLEELETCYNNDGKTMDSFDYEKDNLFKTIDNMSTSLYNEEEEEEKEKEVIPEEICYSTELAKFEKFKANQIIQLEIKEKKLHAVKQDHEKRIQIQKEKDISSETELSKESIDRYIKISEEIDALTIQKKELSESILYLNKNKASSKQENVLEGTSRTLNMILSTRLQVKESYKEKIKTLEAIYKEKAKMDIEQSFGVNAYYYTTSVCLRINKIK